MVRVVAEEPEATEAVVEAIAGAGGEVAGSTRIVVAASAAGEAAFGVSISSIHSEGVRTPLPTVTMVLRISTSSPLPEINPPSLSISSRSSRVILLTAPTRTQPNTNNSSSSQGLTSLTATHSSMETLPRRKPRPRSISSGTVTKPRSRIRIRTSISSLRRVPTTILHGTSNSSKCKLSMARTPGTHLAGSKDGRPQAPHSKQPRLVRDRRSSSLRLIQPQRSSRPQRVRRQTSSSTQQVRRQLQSNNNTYSISCRRWAVLVARGNSMATNAKQASYASISKRSL